MAFVTADRVRDTSTTAGSGSFSVSGTAPTGYRTFSAVLSVSDTFYYSIQHQTLNEWEVGLGTYSSANTFARTTVYSSSNAGSAVTFSAGTKDVFITMAAARSLQLDASGNVTPSINGTLSWQSVQTGNFTAVAGNAYPVNTTSGAVTATLPASPTAGQIVQFSDYAGTFSTNNCSINPNGGKINGSSSNAPLAVSRSSIAVVYIDSTQGWITYSGILSNPFQYSASYLLVAGGGGGGYGRGGGGGAGGLLSGTTVLAPGSVLTITVGAGGSGTYAAATNGANSSVTGLTTAVGGGRGGNLQIISPIVAAGSGGSGGGGGGNVGVPEAGGSATSGQGFAGGTGYNGGEPYNGGGGGGAGAIGQSNTKYANGGIGLASTITGTSVYYAGGGGSGGYFSGGANPGVGSGGTGGGGSGSNIDGTAGTSGTANTGGGGGGGPNSSTTNGGNGGSGVVILNVPTINYSGITTGSPTVTTSGTNTIIKFTASGSYTT
jgi:hypothetical protein